MYKRIFGIFFILMITPGLFAQQYSTTDPLLAIDSLAQDHWVSKQYNAMSLEQKIGQLFMIDVFSEKDSVHTNAAMRLVEKHHIGGIIFSRGTPEKQAKLTNTYQQKAKIPLLIAMDAEWGLSMRLKNTYSFPWNMTLGAIENPYLVEQVGRHIGKHAKRLGVHINFAPDIDINTNPKNPIIGNRSFGEDKENVTQKAIAFTKGMQSVGVLACAKHFPGHGDTDKDSHKTLPTIGFSASRIDSIELYPYKKLIQHDLASAMVAHLNVPSLESRENYPSSISYPIVTGILKERLGFKGLIFTDALNMKGAANFTTPGDIDLAAFLAGNDVLLISENVPKAVAKIKQAYLNRRISEARLAHSVKKILKAKYKVGLHQYKPVALANLKEDLNTQEDAILYEKAIESALTVVKNKQDILPLTNLETKKIAYVGFGDSSGASFLEALQKYAHITQIKASSIEAMLEKLKVYNTVIIGLHRSNASPWKPYDFTKKEVQWLTQIAANKKVILDVFVKPYALLKIPSTTNIEGVIVSYQNSVVAQQKSAELIFGAIEGRGVLPVTAHPDFDVNACNYTPQLSRLSYTYPERVGMSSEKLAKIDSIANLVLSEKMAPGAQILVARKGKVVYHKTFGYHTYAKKRKVLKTDLYDIASLTKITATLPMLMQLEQKGAFTLDTPLAQLLPELKGTNKAKLTVKKMLSHYARLKPWIPFYLKTLDSVTKKPSTTYYRTKPSAAYSVKIAPKLYLRTDYKDSILQRVIDTDLLKSLRYRYSDLPYYLLKEYIESYYQRPLQDLVHQKLYAPLGANYTTYNPLEKFTKSHIVPSERDTYYRYQNVHGYVHDMGAAMQDGVGGHAGVFSNANDIAKIMQLYLQKGYYGGKRYFSTKTIERFNTCYFCDANNRRGVGFDKPQLSDQGPTCGCVSMTSFGHSGFTGTYTWADPDQDIVYVFLSNRTYPSMQNRKLIKSGARTEIQKLIYDAIIE